MVSDVYILNLGSQLYVERTSRLALEARVAELETRLRTLEEKIETMEQKEKDREFRIAQMMSTFQFMGGEV